jgi:hypothetical protein
VNAFNKLISTLPVLTTDEEVLGRLLWNAALEEAAKKCDVLAHIASKAVLSPWHGRTAVQEQEQFMTAASLAVEIRSMQTTAGAAGGEGK